MKFPRKLRPITLAIVACGWIASVSAFAAAPGGTGGTNVHPAAGNLPPYMIVAAGLDNSAYLDCIRMHTKMPAAVNAVANVNAALACQTVGSN